MRKLYLVFFTLLAMIVVILAWLAIPSAMFIDQKSMTIVKNDQGEWVISSIRATPFGTVTANWVSEYRVLGRDDGQSCQASGVAIYSQIPGNVSRYIAPPWAVECLEEGPPIAVTYIRHVLLFGWIPLRPLTYSFVINPDDVPVVEGDLNLTPPGELP